MKEKCTLILLVIILLLIILTKLSFIVPSILEIHNISKLSSDDKNNNNLKVQNNFKKSALSNTNFTTTTTTATTVATTTTKKAITSNKYNRLFKNLILTCSHFLNANLTEIQNNLNNITNLLHNTIYFKSKSYYHQNQKKLFKNIPICYLLVTFMITITLVKFVVVVLAYQQLLQNGYIIIHNLYDKHLRNLNFDFLICSQLRPYQQLLESGHGLDVEENHPNPYKWRCQFLTLVNNFIDEIIKITKSYIRKYQNKRRTSLISRDKLLIDQKYTSVMEKVENNMHMVKAPNNDQLLYHQNSLYGNNHELYQPFYSHNNSRFHIKCHEFLFTRNLFDDGKLFYQLLRKATKTINPINPISQSIFYSKAEKSILFEKCTYFEKTNKLLSSHHIFLRQNALAHSAASSILVSAASSASLTSQTSTSIYSSIKKLKKKSNPTNLGFVFMQRMLRSCIDRIESLPNYYQPNKILPSLTSLSSTILCCWKASAAGNRKRRKRKFSFIWDDKNEYIRNCGRSFTLFTNNSRCYCYSCCCGCGCNCCCCYYHCCCCLKDQFCNEFFNNNAGAGAGAGTRTGSEVILLKCCKTYFYCSCYCCCNCRNNCVNYHHYHCIYQINSNYPSQCSIPNNSSCLQLNIFKTNNHNKTTTIRLSKNIYNLAEQTSDHHQGRNKWCLQTSSHAHHQNEADVNGGNLLQSLNAVKDITSSVVHNRANNNKRKLKKNLVWLFIGLVWLEGPKLINCSINHNNNDVTSLNGSETTNKIDSSNGSGAGGQNQNRNGDNSSNGNSSGSRNSSSRNNNEGGTSNTNGPGTNAPETNSKGQKVKIPESEASNGGSVGSSGGVGLNSANINEFFLNENQKFSSPSYKRIPSRPIMSIENQLQYKTFGHQEPVLPTSSYIDMRKNLTPKRSNRNSIPPILYVSEEANRAQSDLSRLESIKRQILTKLGLTEKPNVTHPLPKQFIWDTIYRADGIRSVHDFDFNDNNHRLQEHMRLKATGVLEPPPLLSRQNSMSNSNINQKNQLINRNSISNDVKESRTPRSHNKNTNKDNKMVKHLGTIGSRWKLFNSTIEQTEKIHQKFLRKYRQQRFRNNVHVLNRNKNRFFDPDYLEGDEFFGSTQEIITFAEKGKVYKKHRLVEFSPPSNKIPKQKLQVRNAEIHIRIEKVPAVSEKTSINKNKRRHHQKLNIPNSSSEPGLKIWIFQLIGNDFSQKGFDQVAKLCTSLSVDHNVLGWQKLDITETVQYWYGKEQNEKLRLLIDCTGCGNRYILHLFDRKFHNSPILPTTTQTTNFHQSLNDTVEQQNYKIYNNYSSLIIERNHAHSSSYNNKKKNNESLRNLYHQRQYSHHRYRRKNRTIKAQKLKINSDSSDTTKKASANVQLSQFDGQHNVVSYAQSLWHKSRTYRQNREITNPYSISQDQDQNQKQNQDIGNVQKNLDEGMSYEIAAAEFHLEDRLNPNRPFLVLHTEPSRSRRVRRRAVDCSGAIHGQCCKESFYVSFKALGWDDWIIAPRGYFANYCRGDCTGPFRTPDTFQTFHAHFIEEYRKMGLLNGMQPCCAPVKFSSMSLIYYGDDGIIKRDLPKMVVDECGCP
ncbi:uncharacterized protein LOC129953293 [Eupeodes corollae]|uniref:uncharacterized protein LOC129953293 n=1 Tax=Eupeodes corollae TaxID=290404 RepID=UPI0024914E15|nr:uncharacterized protein LOC129953293 [Eupeodes corollae]XP_055922314.1 uncharacterized protein LOC129953293 [Eupeodes corollae]XP_055922315.1 uncharacterized protein LOC129953293 [Eupeodes corollae]XP_055922316.1 uncharacterized protein LOC129953293 [Eupeodes corollae]